MRHKPEAASSLTALSIFLITFGFLLCVSGLLVAYVICVDRVSEFSYGARQQNGWVPFSGGFIDGLRHLPKALYVAAAHFPRAALAALAFFPLLIVAVPLYDAIFLSDYTLLLNGVLPVVAGVSCILWAVYLQDSHRKSKPGKLEFDD